MIDNLLPQKKKSACRTETSSCSHAYLISPVSLFVEASSERSPYRAVATGPVIRFQLDPFPPPVACLGSPIAWQIPTQYLMRHRYHDETCEMATNSATELFRESSKNFPFLQAND